MKLKKMASSLGITSDISTYFTLGVYDFRLCETSDKKVHLALSRLGKSNIEVIIKFLTILGEVRTGEELFELVKDEYKYY